jgi:hypothetical protein
MEGQYAVRWGWMRFMYAVTIIFPGSWGLATLFLPEMINEWFPFSHIVAKGMPREGLAR